MTRYICRVQLVARLPGHFRRGPDIGWPIPLALHRKCPLRRKWDVLLLGYAHFLERKKNTVMNVNEIGSSSVQVTRPVQVALSPLGYCITKMGRDLKIV